MIQTVAPLQYFPISRVLPDPSDATVYFVMAEVRNGSTGVLLASVKLLSQGSQIYSGVYRAPALASSQGLFLTVTTRVYTDAGYSVPSTSYGNDQDTFQVFDQTNQTIVAAQQIAAIVAGSIPDNSPADVDYKKIEKIVLKLVGEVVGALKSELAVVHSRIDSLDFKTDLAPVLRAIEAKNVDMSPVLAAVQHIDLAPLHQKLAEVRASLPREAPSLDPILAGLEALKTPQEHTDRVAEIHTVATRILDMMSHLSEGTGKLLAANDRPFVLRLGREAEEEKKQAAPPPRNAFGRVLKN